MILIDEISDKKEVLPPYSPTTAHLRPRGHPPRATSSSSLGSDSQSPSPSSSSTTLISSPLPTPRPQTRTSPPPIQPSNHLYIHRENAAIRGTYVIDPALVVPPCFLVDLAPHERRTNATFMTKNGTVDVEVWVQAGFARQRRRAGSNRRASSSSGEGSAGHGSAWGSYNSANAHSELGLYSEPTVKSTRTDIEVRSEIGAVALKLHARPQERISVHVSSWNGPASVELPRTFHGPIYTKSDLWRTQFSSTIEQFVTPFSMESKKGRYFVGDSSNWNEDDWDGDELRIESRNGSLTVAYIDEPDSDLPRGNGFLGKLRHGAMASRISLSRLG